MQKALKETNNLNISSVDEVEFDYSEDEEDADLIRLVEERLKNDNGVRYTWEEFKEMHGIKDEDLEGWEEVEFE